MPRTSKFFEAMNAYDDHLSERAVLLMEECAEAGDPVACFTTALWYGSGEGVSVNPERSAHWLSRLEEIAEKGNSEAQWEVGQNYRFGNLLPLDIERANHWLERAAESGYGEAQHHLASYLEFGQYGYQVDTAEAGKWYQRAFEQEHPETLYVFAGRHFKDGLPTDEAIRLLRKAADKGFKQAQDVLSLYLRSEP